MIVFLKKYINILLIILPAVILLYSHLFWNFLSIFQGINRSTAVVGFIPIVFVVIFTLYVNAQNIYTFFKEKVILYYFIPLFLVIMLTSWIYPPNNWDSMTYHMSRVVHWIQNGSVGYYYTSIDRQNLLSFGSEYIILWFQLITNTDRFANFIHTFSLFWICFSSYSIFKKLKLDSNIISFSLILLTSIPMALLQASSTQNDLLASLMAVSIIQFNIFFLKKKIDVFVFLLLLPILIGTAYLVKPTSLLPVLIFSFYTYLYSIIKNRNKLLLQKRTYIIISVSILFFALILTPDLYRKYKHTGSLTGNRHEVYTLKEGLLDRTANSIRGFLYHIPIQSFCENDFSKMLKEKSTASVPDNFRSSPCSNASIIHEDYIGNFSTILALPVFCVYLMLYRRGFVFMTLSIVSWLSFHFIVKDQPWISRLQTPIFYSIIYFFILDILYSKKLVLSKNSNGLENIFILPTIWFCIIYSFYTLFNNRSRIINFDVFQRERFSLYFENKKDLLIIYQSITDHVIKNGYNSLGLYIGGDTWEYPITWYLYKQGVRVYHYNPIEKKKGYVLIEGNRQIVNSELVQQFGDFKILKVY